MKKWQENGEKRAKMGKLKNRGHAGDDRKGEYPLHFISPLPIPQPTGKTKSPLRRREVGHEVKLCQQLRNF